MRAIWAPHRIKTQCLSHCSFTENTFQMLHACWATIFLQRNVYRAIEICTLVVVQANGWSLMSRAHFLHPKACWTKFATSWCFLEVWNFVVSSIRFRIWYFGCLMWHVGHLLMTWLGNFHSFNSFCPTFSCQLTEFDFQNLYCTCTYKEGRIARRGIELFPRRVSEYVRHTGILGCNNPNHTRNKSALLGFHWLLCYCGV